MKQYQLYEYKSPFKFATCFSPEFEEKIEIIKAYNQNNEYAITQLKNELLAILNHISNPSIAWCYSQKYKQNSRETIFSRILGYDIIYNIVTDNNGASVCIIDINFNPEEFGLKTPQLNENNVIKKRKILYLKESQLRQIIREVIYRIMA